MTIDDVQKLLELAERRDVLWPMPIYAHQLKHLCQRVIAAERLRNSLHLPYTSLERQEAIAQYDAISGEGGV